VVNNFQHMTIQVFRTLLFSTQVYRIFVFFLIIGGYFCDQSLIIVFNFLGLVINLTHCVGLLGICSFS
jgi:hypothetical protein